MTVEVGHRHGGSMDYPKWASNARARTERKLALFTSTSERAFRDQWLCLPVAADADAYDHFDGGEV